MDGCKKRKFKGDPVPVLVFPLFNTVHVCVCGGMCVLEVGIESEKIWEAQALSICLVVKVNDDGFLWVFNRVERNDFCSKSFHNKECMERQRIVIYILFIIVLLVCFCYNYLELAFSQV